MKKLFLYTAVLAAIFFIAYASGTGIYRRYFENRKRIEVKDYRSDFSGSQAYTIQSDAVYPDFQETAGPADAKSEEENSSDESENETTKPEYRYRLSYSGGYVVVVDPDGILYEYTDIEKTLLPKNIENDIERGLYFDNLIEVYEYLESIAS